MSRNSFHNELSTTFDFLINGYNLFVKYSYKLEAYDLKNNIQIFIKEERRTKNFSDGSDDLNEFLCNYDYNYFIARKNGRIRIYKFEKNGAIKSYKELKFDKFQIKGIKKLKKNSFLIYNENNIKIFTIK